MKNPFKRKKNAIPTPPVPRSEEEIKKVYYQLSSRAGELQYQVTIHEEELKQLNNVLRELNYEMKARLDLNAAAKTEEAKKGVSSQAGAQNVASAAQSQAGQQNAGVQ
jgi:hypothetical protein